MTLTSEILEILDEYREIVQELADNEELILDRLSQYGARQAYITNVAEVIVVLQGPVRKRMEALGRTRDAMRIMTKGYTQ